MKTTLIDWLFYQGFGNIVIPVVLCKNYLTYQIYKFYIKHYDDPSTEGSNFKIKSIYKVNFYTGWNTVICCAKNSIVVVYSHYLVASTLLNMYFK